jgi:hypothetical protein
MSKVTHEHKHCEVLHKNLEELVSRFIAANEMKYLSGTTVLELLEWSHKQCKSGGAHGIKN